MIYGLQKRVHYPQQNCTFRCSHGSWVRYYPEKSSKIMSFFVAPVEQISREFPFRVRRIWPIYGHLFHSAQSTNVAEHDWIVCPRAIIPVSRVLPFFVVVAKSDVGTLDVLWPLKTMKTKKVVVAKYGHKWCLMAKFGHKWS